MTHADDPDDPDDEPEAVSRETPADDSVEPRTYRTKVREQSIRETERGNFWRAVLHSDVGRRELWGVLQDAHTFETAFGISPVGFPDPHKTFFEAGAQAFGHRLFLTLMRYARDGAMLMLSEHDHRLAEPEQPRRRKGHG